MRLGFCNGGMNFLISCARVLFLCIAMYEQNLTPIQLGNLDNAFSE